MAFLWDRPLLPTSRVLSWLSFSDTRLWRGPRGSLAALILPGRPFVGEAHIDGFEIGDHGVDNHQGLWLVGQGVPDLRYLGEDTSATENVVLLEDNAQVVDVVLDILRGNSTFFCDTSKVSTALLKVVAIDL